MKTASFEPAPYLTRGRGNLLFKGVVRCGEGVVRCGKVVVRSFLEVTTDLTPYFLGVYLLCGKVVRYNRVESTSKENTSKTPLAPFRRSSAPGYEHAKSKPWEVLKAGLPHTTLPHQGLLT